MGLNDYPEGDSIHIIYDLENEINNKLIEFIVEIEGRITFKEMFDKIEKKENKKISHCMIIAEYGLEGTIYRYNNYGQGEILISGHTKGYA